MHIARSGIGRMTLLQERISATTECGIRVPDGWPAPGDVSPGARLPLCAALKSLLLLPRTSRGIGRRDGGSGAAQ